MAQENISLIDYAVRVRQNAVDRWLRSSAERQSWEAIISKQLMLANSAGLAASAGVLATLKMRGLLVPTLLFFMGAVCVLLAMVCAAKSCLRNGDQISQRIRDLDESVAKGDSNKIDAELEKVQSPEDAGKFLTQTAIALGWVSFFSLMAGAAAFVAIIMCRLSA
ncbi:MAG: hypothetical protein WBF88_12225 [Pusillimonas sp.]